ncbi:MAG: hypothetical protein H5T99_07085, partial [Moorella sp. (in: Bacteria)]|nr:hypothetical protein [Moorella sp. (in: firmicutes)]
MSGQSGVQFHRRGLEAAGPHRTGLDLFFLVAAFFLARGALLAELFPFGAAGVITTAALRPRLLWPVVISSMVGSWLAGPDPFYSRPLLFLVLGLIHSFYPALQRSSILTRATLAPVTIVLVRGVSLTLAGPSFYGWVQVIFEALLSWGLALAFLEAAIAARPEERFLGAGLFLLGVLLGLQGWQLAGLSLQSIAGCYLLLLAALAGGPGAGAAAGAAVGFLPSLSQLVTPALAGLLAFTGLIAGSLKSLGKPGVISGFLLAQLLLASYFLGQDSLLAALKEGGIVAIALAATPSILVQQLQKFMATRTTPGVQEGVSSQEKLKTALKSLARSLKFSGFRESPLETIRQVARVACRGCPAGKVCWELEGEQMVTLLQELLEKAGQGPLTGAEVPEWLASRCGRRRELLAALAGEAGRLRTRPADEGLNSWLIATFETLATMLEAGESRPGTATGEEAAAPVWKVSVGVAGVPRYQADVSGDAYLALALDPRYYLLVLGDG